MTFPSRASLMAVLLLSLPACSATGEDGSRGPSGITAPLIGPDSVARDVATLAGTATRPEQPKEFVVATRSTGQIDYIPVGVTPTKRLLAPKTPAELAAFQAGLEKSRDSSATFAKRPAPVMPTIAQPRKLPRIPGDTLSPPDADALPGPAETIPVPQRLKPKRIQDN